MEVVSQTTQTFSSLSLHLQRRKNHHRPIPSQPSHSLPIIQNDDITKIRNSIPKKAYFTSIDLSEAYWHVPIHARFQKYLAFTFQGRLYMYLAMPFGINIGPRIFSKIITEVLIQLHYQKIRLSVYIDDILLWDTSAQDLLLHIQMTIQLLTDLGFSINWDKSTLIPSQNITYLGVTLMGQKHLICPSLQNIQKTKELVLQILTLPYVTKKKIQQLLGSLNFLAPLINEDKFQLRIIVLNAPSFKK